MAKRLKEHSVDAPDRANVIVLPPLIVVAALAPQVGRPNREMTDG
jgi:hypothetical protein